MGQPLKVVERFGCLSVLFLFVRAFCFVCVCLAGWLADWLTVCLSPWFARADAATYLLLLIISTLINWLEGYRAYKRPPERVHRLTNTSQGQLMSCTVSL